MTTATSSRTTPAAVEFALLQSWLASGSALQLPLHEIECPQQARGREVQRLLLQAHLQQRGNGDVGPALYLQQPDGELLYSHRRMGTRSLTTVFGTVELVRLGYSRPGMPGIFPLDRALTLPARSFSYELQRRLVKAAVQNPFLDSVQTIADRTGVSVSKRSLEQILPDAAQTLTLFTGSVRRSPPPAPSLWPPSIARAFPWSSRRARNQRRDCRKDTRPTRSAWPRLPLSSLAHPGCALRNTSWKAYSASPPDC